MFKIVPNFQMKHLHVCRLPNKISRHIGTYTLTRGEKRTVEGKIKTGNGWVDCMSGNLMLRVKRKKNPEVGL